MIDILSRANVGVLEDFARSNTLLAFDYDGTLAPIVDDPGSAEMRPKTRALLAAVAAVYPVTVISGRAQADVTRRLRGVGVASVIGNHGIESWHKAGRSGADVHGWLPAIAAAAAPIKGVVIEDKTFSVAVHYRASREKKKARDAILRAASSVAGVRVIPGKQVVNILPLDAPHKGIALERERHRLGCDTAVYVGDDTTDEDVFALDQPGRLLSVRVGSNRSSAAAYALANQKSIDAFLSTLAACRRAVGQTRRASS
jgi:trehalose 6-phosphate phosphatase